MKGFVLNSVLSKKPKFLINVYFLVFSSNSVYVILISKGYQTCYRENWGRHSDGDGMKIVSV